MDGSPGEPIARRVLVVGLDSLAPALAFERYRDAMPCLRSLVEAGVSARLRSCDPPITVPAWAAMASGQTPGRLGLYGFRQRVAGSYRDVRIASSQDVREPCVWDELGRLGRPVTLVGVPPSYPPRRVLGKRVGCFLTPTVERPFTYPASLGPELLSIAGDYRFDVPFRTDRRAELLHALHAMTDGHFDVVDHLLAEDDWDLFWLVEIGVDRVHHAFWAYADPEHPLYAAGNPYEDAIRDYYARVDARLGALVERAGDETAVLVVSDHGAKAAKGALAVNEWLRRTGWLHLAAEPPPGTPIDEADVDWSRTRAWAWGGYYARVFLNLAGREPGGIVARDDYDRVVEELRAALSTIPDENGGTLPVAAHRPEELYPEVRGDPPDLLVYLDDLAWRAAGTVGWEGIHLAGNDTGPDGAVHDWDGCFVLAVPGRPRRARLEDGLSIGDVAPTILDLLGIEPRERLPGASALRPAVAAAAP